MVMTLYRAFTRCQALQSNEEGTSCAPHRARNTVSARLTGAGTVGPPEVVSGVELWRHVQHKNRKPAVGRRVTLSPQASGAGGSTCHAAFSNLTKLVSALRFPTFSLF